MYVYFPLPFHRAWFTQMMGMFAAHGNDYDMVVFISRALRNALISSYESEELINMLSLEFHAGPYRILEDHQLIEDDVGGVQNWFWNEVELAVIRLTDHFISYLTPNGEFPRWSYSFISLDEDSVCFFVEKSYAPACIY